MTELVAAHVDLPRVAAVAASTIVADPWDPATAVDGVATGPVTVAMASGKAFTFGYAEHVEMLQAAGADVVGFDPLVDALPSGADALVIPGGFPEQFTAELAANDLARQQVQALARSGAPVHAECAGLTYLASDLEGHPMCGVLSASARFTDHLTLGYRDAVAVTDSAVHAVGERVVGHEFHRTTVEFTDSYPPAWAYAGAYAETVRDGAVHAGVHASYLHTHPAGSPHAVTRFVSRAAASRLAPMSRLREEDSAPMSRLREEDSAL
jgi:cobyrinic acid a,c-diamide synthase